MKARDIDEDGARLLNVALSRSRSYIVLLANFSYLRKTLRKDTFTLRVLEHFQ